MVRRVVDARTMRGDGDVDPFGVLSRLVKGLGCLHVAAVDSPSTAEVLWNPVAMKNSCKKEKHDGGEVDE